MENSFLPLDVGMHVFVRYGVSLLNMLHLGSFREKSNVTLLVRQKDDMHFKIKQRLELPPSPPLVLTTSGCIINFQNSEIHK